MPALDPSSKATVDDFAQSLGLSARENDDGSFGFDFTESGRFSIVAAPQDDLVLVSLRRRILLEDLIPLARLAASGGPDLHEGLVFQPGLTSKDQPVLTAAIARRAFDLPRLNSVFLAMDRVFKEHGL